MSENNTRKNVTAETFSSNPSQLAFNNIGAELTFGGYDIDINTANEHLLRLVTDILGDVVSAKFRYYPKSEGKEVETSGKSTTLKSETVAEVVISYNNPHFVSKGGDNDDPFVSGRRRKDYDETLTKFLKDFGIADDAPDVAKASTAKRSIYTASGESRILLLEPLKIFERFFDTKNYGYQDAYGKSPTIRPTIVQLSANIGTRGENKGRLLGYTVVKRFPVNKRIQEERSIFKPGRHDDDDYRDRGNRDDRRDRRDRDNRRNDYRKDYDEGSFRDKDSNKFIKD